MPNDKLAKMAEEALMSLERPDFIPTSQEGTDHITKDDVQLPRLSIAQAMSPEIEEGHAKLIPGLRVGDLFNSLTKQIYGRGPLTFAIARSDKPRYVEFIPREQGGGVKDPDVPAGDPRTQFWVDEDGKRHNPDATMFRDYVIVLFSEEGVREVVALSFKSTGLSVAKQLNGLIKVRKAPIYAGLYQLKSVSAKNAKGTFYKFDVSPAGWPKTEEQMNFMKELYESLKDKKVEYVRDGDDHDVEGDTDFPHGENVEGAASEM